jgi:hypothetical protein
MNRRHIARKHELRGGSKVKRSKLPVRTVAAVLCLAAILRGTCAHADQMSMATSLARATPKQYDSAMSRATFASGCNDIACRSTKRIRPSTDPPTADWATRMFDRKDCLEPAEGSAQFDDLTAYRSPPHMRDELLLGQDCGPAGSDDAED